MARPREALISRESVIAAAMAIMDSDGFESLSLRRLGTDLKVNSASLYHHFKNKEDILLAVARTALRDMQLPPLTDDWQKWISENAVIYRRILIARPFLIPLMLNGVRPRTLATAITEAKLTEAGVPANMQSEMIFALDTTVIGSALVSIATENELKNTARKPHFDHEKVLRSTITALLTSLMDEFAPAVWRRRKKAKAQEDQAVTK